MTILGKLLLFVNLLAAAAFVYFATQDWQRRQTINGAALKMKVFIEGAPLGGEAGDPADMPNDPEAEIPIRMVLAGFPVDTVGKGFWDAYFKDVPPDPVLGGGPVPNQLAEVKRVKAKIDTLLREKADNLAEKLGLLRGFLLFQAETLAERQAILAAYDAKNVEDLEKLLNAKFAAVTESPKTADLAFAKEPLPDVVALQEELNKMRAAKANPDELAAKENQVKAAEAAIIARQAKIAETRGTALDKDDRKSRLAHLLVHLSQDATWQKRVAAVVGMRMYVAAVAAQAERFIDMSYGVELLMYTDQAGFLNKEQDLLGIAINNTDLANHQAAIKRNKIAEKEKEDDFVGQRNTQLAAIKNQLNKTKAEVDELLSKQSTIEAALFEVQREIAITLEQVYRKEEALDKRERELLKLPARKQP